MIIEGTLPPGTRLNERVLCEQLMVSRTPLREAFKVLAGEGLIELLPNRGAQVAELSVADIEQTFEVLGALEGLSGQLACERITDAEITEIRALHYEMQAAHARRDLAAYYKINHVIHDRINASAGNAVLTSDLPADERAHPEPALPLQLQPGQVGCGDEGAQRHARCARPARRRRLARHPRTPPANQARHGRRRPARIARRHQDP